MTPRVLCTLLAAAVAASQAAGVTMIEARDGEGEVQLVYFEGQRMRVEVKGQDGHVLVDPGARRVYAVEPAERRVVDMSALFFRTASGKPAANARLVRRGSGPAIAGYATERYAVLAGKSECGEVLLSRTALDAAPDGARLLEGLAAFARSAPIGPGSPCEQAGEAVLPELARHGLPLRHTGADGKLEMEVTRIVRDAKMPAGGFSPPPGWTVVDAGEQVREAMRQAEEAMRKMAPPPGAAGREPTAEELRRALEQLQRRMQR